VARPLHLARRFFGALAPARPAPADVAWVAGVLNERELAVWNRLPRHDRRHSIQVARDVEAALAGTEYAGDPRWIEAALLHDIGKLDAGLGVFGRVAATLAGAAAGHDMAEPWSHKRGITRRFGLYLRHPELGADRIRICAGRAEAAVWAECHQDPTRYDGCGLPPVVVAALSEADDD
jgi:hypothetical protein